MPGTRGTYGERGGSSHRRATVSALPSNAPAGEMEQACLKAFEAMPWLKDSDEVMKKLIIKYAQLMDGPEGAYMTYRMGPHLVDALKQMAATPTARFYLFGNEKSTSGKLAELRAKRGA